MKSCFFLPVNFFNNVLKQSNYAIKTPNIIKELKAQHTLAIAKTSKVKHHCDGVKTVKIKFRLKLKLSSNFKL